jgi:hypothetical protein
MGAGLEHQRVALRERLVEEHPITRRDAEVELHRVRTSGRRETRSDSLASRDEVAREPRAVDP